MPISSMNLKQEEDKIWDAPLDGTKPQNEDTYVSIVLLPQRKTYLFV